MTTTASPPVASGTGLPDVSQITSSDAALRRFLHGLPGVDQVGAEARAAMLGTRSIKTTAKAWAIDLAISMIDLTTLEGAGHPGQGARAVRQGAASRPGRPDTPAGRRRLRLPRPGRRSPSRRCAAAACTVASVATAFPSGRASARRQARRHRGRGRGRRRRDRHGDRPRRVPVRPLPRGLRRDRRGQGRPAATRTSR